MPKQNALRAGYTTKVNMLIKGMCLVLRFLDGLDLFFMSTGTYLTEVWHLWSKSSWQCMEWLPLLSFCLWPNRTWIWMFSLKCNSWVTVIWMYSKNRNTMLQCSDSCSYILRSWQKLLHGRQDSCADCIEPWIEMYRLSMLCLFWCWWEWLDTGGRREDSRLTNVYAHLSLLLESWLHRRQLSGYGNNKGIVPISCEELWKISRDLWVGLNTQNGGGYAYPEFYHVRQTPRRCSFKLYLYKDARYEEGPH